MQTTGTEPDDKELDSRLHLAAFIRNELYPHNIRPGSSEWSLGRIHWTEWSRIATQKRARILAPRDHLKSFFFVEAKTLWEAWNESCEEILILGLNDKKAYERLDNIKRFIKRVPKLRYLYENHTKWDITEIKLSTGLKISAQGFLSGLRGGHPDIILLDDPIDMKVFYSETINEKSVDRFYAELLPMAQPHTQILVSGTIQRRDDLYHSFNPKTWTLKTYSAIIDAENKITLFPELWPWDKLMERKEEIVFKLGTRYWLKEYENNVSAMEGQIFKEAWIKYVRRRDLPVMRVRINGWDLASKKKVTSKFTAGICLGLGTDGQFYLMDVRRGQYDLEERLSTIQLFANLTAANEVCIEDNVFQDDTVQMLRGRLIMPIRGITTLDDKMQRAESNAIYFMPEHDKMRIVCEDFDQDGMPVLSPPIKVFVEELISCPGSYFDQIDAMDIAIRGILKYAGQQDHKALIKELEESRSKSNFTLREF